MTDKERLRQALLRDMKHWSVDTLKFSINYIDGMVLSMEGEDFLWWWEFNWLLYGCYHKRTFIHIFVGKDRVFSVTSK